MRCAVHPEVEASGYCRNCGKALCATCVRPVREVLYCEDCLAALAGLAPPPVAEAPGAGAPPGTLPAAPSAGPGGNPGIAFLLGLVPGLGAIYNGEYNKALIHIVIFAAIILGLSSELGDGMTAILVVMLIVFIFYMAIDATRTVKARQGGTTAPDPLETWSKNRPVGAIILIAVGALFLLNNFGFFDYFRVRQVFWPLVLIGIGAMMLRNRVGGQS